MGAAYVELGDKQKAVEILDQAIALQTGAANRRDEGVARVSAGMAYHKMGNDEKAVESINQGLDIFRQVSRSPK